MYQCGLIFYIFWVTNILQASQCPQHPHEWPYPFRYTKIHKRSSPSNPLHIFSWTKAIFDPQKPSLIYITGGPGESAHQSYFELTGWNLIFFDMRGIACSRWKDRLSIASYQSFSSQLIADDMEQIRLDYKIKKWSIYATSYGTIPATIYAHKYSKSIHKLVLEGTIFEGGSRLLSSKRFKYLLQTFFDQLPITFKQKIISLSNEPDINPHWFSAAGLMMFYLDSSFNVFNQFLAQTLVADKNSVLLNSFIRAPDLSFNDLNFSTYFMAMIGCQELGLNLDHIGPYLVFKQNQLIPSSFNPYRDNLCKPLLPKSYIPSKLYSALDYPAQVNTVYIQGEHDGATTADHAFRHYNQWASRSKKILLAKEGGHLPFSANLTSNFISPHEKNVKNKLLNALLNDSSSLIQDIQTLSQISNIKWQIINP